MNEPKLRGPIGPKWKLYALAGGAALVALAAILYFATRGGSPKPQPAPPAPPAKTVAEKPADPPLRLPPKPPPRQTPPAPPTPAAPVKPDKPPAGLLPGDGWRTALPPVPAQVPDFKVTPHGAYAQDAFEDLFDEKLRVLTIGDASKLLVPPGLRFKPVAADELVRQIAAYASLEVAWYRNQWVAVLYRKANDAKVARLLEGLAAKDPALRARAAWTGRWVRDPRVFEALLNAARDADAEVARQALRALRTVGWETLLLAHPQHAYPLFREELTRYGPGQRDACAALAVLDPKLVIAAIGAELDRGAGTIIDRSMAGKILGLMNNEQAIEELERRVKSGQLNCLGALRGHLHFDTPGALQMLAEQWKDEGWKQALPALAREIGASRHPDKFKLLPEALNSKERFVAQRAIEGLARNGGPREFQTVVEALDSKNPEAAAAAARTLGLFGEQAWPHVEKILAEQKPVYNPKARNFGGPESPYQAALASLGHLGDEKSVAILRQHLAEPDITLRNGALTGLSLIRGDAVTKMLMEELEHPDSKVAPELMTGFGRNGGPAAFDLIQQSEPKTHRHNAGEYYVLLAQSNPERALPLIVKALGNEDGLERHRAKAALEWLDGDDAMVLLEDVLKKEGSAAHILALKLYAKCGDARGLDYIRRNLELLSKPIESEEMSTIGEIGGPGALKMLAAPLTGDDERQVGSALSALFHFVGDLDAAGKAETVRLLQAVKPVHWPLHHDSIADRLGALGDERAVPFLDRMRMSLKDQEGSGSGHKEVYALQRIGGPKARAVIKRIMADPNEKDAFLAMLALGRDGDDEARDLLLARIGIEETQYLLEVLKKRLVMRWPNDAKAREGVQAIDAKLRKFKPWPKVPGMEIP